VDITKLHGPAKWTYFYLYTIIDIYSRYVPGWMLARAERASLAEALLAETIEKQGIGSGELTIHSDRGSPMIASRRDLLADLGVIKSHSRPHVSNDNPYIESHFRTLKYRPDFPKSFGSFEDAHDHCGRFFIWYNDEHRHSGIGFHTPAMSTMAAPSASASTEDRSSTPPMSPIRSASCARHPSRRSCPPSLDQPTGGCDHDTVITEQICLAKVDRRRCG